MDNYENFLNLMKYRRSIRKFKPDPIPKDYVTKILDAAHYAMSGGNSQPWEFIIINDPETKRKLADAYQTDYEQAWNLELMRAKQYRHPALNTPLKDIDKALATVTDWINAPLATHVRIYIRDIKSTHSSLHWGWANNIFLRINNISVARTPYGNYFYGHIVSLY